MAGNYSPATAEILKEVTALRGEVAETKAALARAEAVRDTGAATARGVHIPSGAAPYARKGENIMGSRGFSFGKIFGSLAGHISPDEAKIEHMLCQKTMDIAQKGRYSCVPNKPSCLVPIWPDGFNESMCSNDDYYEMKGLLAHGVSKADPDEMDYWHKKAYTAPGQKAAPSPSMSWTDQSQGGTFVPPAMFGQPIELLRSREALMNAGCTVMPMSPSGRITFPRLITPTTAAGTLENTQGTAVNPTTGALELMAKKVMSLVLLPNELLRFASPAVEALIRADVFKTVALQLDKNLLEGAGSQTQTLGLATMGAAAGNPYGLAIVTPSAANQLAGQDAYAFMSAVEENNGDPEGGRGGWIMRPKMAYAWYQARWTPYSGGTSQGGFLFEITRGLDGKAVKNLAGYPITSTVQVSNTRGSNQTYILFAPWEDYILSLFGAIEFVQTTEGYNLTSSDQTLLRCILTGDGGPRHPGVFAFCDNLNLSVSG
jgi:HK97 family phage major capsid protein